MDHFFPTFLAMILKKLTKEENDQTTVATYGGISKLYTIQISIYLFFLFTDKVRGKKTEQPGVTTYGRRIHVYIFLRVQLFG